MVKSYKSILIIILSIIMLSIPVFANVKVTMENPEVTNRSSTTTSNSTSGTSSANKESQLLKLEKDLKAKEQELAERERLLDEREDELNQREELLAREEESENKESLIVDGGNLKRIGSVNDEQVNAVMDGFNQLPSLVQETLVAANYRIEVTDEDIEKLITGGGTNSWYGASASAPLWVILVANNQKLTDMTRTMIHECGHCYDDILGNWSLKPSWRACYATEGKTLYDTALVSNEKEWFAECFTFYLTNKEYLQRVAPTSYQTIDTLFHELYQLNGKDFDEEMQWNSILTDETEEKEEDVKEDSAKSNTTSEKTSSAATKYSSITRN